MLRYRQFWLQAYISTVTLAGGVIVFFALRIQYEDPFGLVLFAAMAAASELANVRLFKSSRSSVSVSSMVAIGSILAFGPWAGALTHLASGFAAALKSTLSEKNDKARASLAQRAGFNAGMWVASAALAGWIFSRTGGQPGEMNLLANGLPLFLAAGVDTLANLVILIGVIGIQTGRSPLKSWRQDFQWAAPIAILGGFLGGGALGMAYLMFGVLGLMVFSLPVLSMSYSFHLYVANMKTYVSQLEDANESLERANLGLLETLGGVIDAYDAYTYGHSAQVAVYAGALAEKMGLAGEDKDRITRAALVHDIGKVGITDTIIGKQGALSPEERNIVRRHPAIGAEILGRMEDLRDLALLVRHHHERWDGAGYPDGLAGVEIPLGARVLALADTLDAMCSDRPYRKTLSFKEIQEEIFACSGKQFDPQVVQAFSKLLEERERNFFKNSAASVDSAMLGMGFGKVSLQARYLKRSAVSAP